MSILSRLFGHKRQTVSTADYQAAYIHRLKARYDAAQTTHENERHWANSDYSGPSWANNHDVRRKTRARARYEILENNCYASGIARKKTNHVIGTGPRLEMNTGIATLDQDIEGAFSSWLRKSRTVPQLRTHHLTRQVQGEGFLEFTNNPQIDHPVQLAVRGSEPDLWTEPYVEFSANPDSNDGITYDAWGNPTSYQRLKQHPGDQWPVGLTVDPLETDTLSADTVVHWFTAIRPDQKRGVTEFVAALPLFAQLRRWTISTLAAAETAAHFASVLKSNAAAFQDTAYDPRVPKDEQGWTIDIERNAMVTLPHGWEMQQLRAEQPTTTYAEFEEAIVKQVAQCALMPLNLAVGSSRDSNFASARLDIMQFYAACDVEQNDCELWVMEPIFEQFLREYAFSNPRVGVERELRHRWQWPARQVIDELKAAQARQILHELGYETDQDWFADTQRDPETHYQRLRDQVEQRTEIEPEESQDTAA